MIQYRKQVIWEVLIRAHLYPHKYYRMFVVAKKSIEVGEELLVDYGGDYAKDYE